LLATDIAASARDDAVSCDLRSDRDVAELFAQRRFSAVVHLAAVLPTAFRSDLLYGGELNLSGTMRLLRASVDSGVSRFVFGSSTSVYGNSARPLCAESSDPLPDEPYGAAKLAIEKILDLIPSASGMETVSLRIARVLGPGAERSGSPWRSQIFKRSSPGANLLTIPFAPDAILSVVHVDDLARMFQTLVEAHSLPARIYNTPVELIRAGELGRMAQHVNGWQVSLGVDHGGPEIDGARFARDFDFMLRPMRATWTTPD
jgi:nucleoside-diphosphate-sugar epimerase